jgi:adenosine deaminase
VLRSAHAEGALLGTTESPSEEASMSAKIPDAIRKLSKTELHQHVDGSIPPAVTWRIMKRFGLNPVESLAEMKKLLMLQPAEEGSLLSYLDKFHYPMWITQFYENITQVTYAICAEAAKQGVKTLELRYSPIIHIYGGLTIRQAIRSVLSALNRAEKEFGIDTGLVVIAMRHHGPHIAKILARGAAGDAQHLHGRSGVIGFDIAGAEKGNAPRLFHKSYEIARQAGLGLTAHAGEDEGPAYIWQAIDELGCTRIGHGCSAIHDKALLKRMAKDKILVECAPSSNYQTGAVKRGERHPLFTFLEHGIPVALCTDNTTVSNTNQNKESALFLKELGIKEIRRIHRDAREYSFIPKERRTAKW